MNKTITIIGGKGLMGELFTKLWQEIGYVVYQIGSTDWDKLPSSLAKSDAVIISVPIEKTTDIIKQITPLLPDNIILADFTSIKSTPLINMLREFSGSVIGLHPMFGSTINTPQNQVIVHCEGRNPEKCQWLIDSLSQIGFTLKSMEAAEHDEAMNFIQGIEHFLTFSLGTFLQHKNQHPEKLLEIASPIYLAKLLLMGRIFDQDPKLYADIIMADKSRLELIKEFSIWLNHWVQNLEQYNKEEFIAEFTKASQWMGKFTRYSQHISDKFLTIDLEEHV
ncbi:MAG: bifunctional chorismate mutase/prephenate dehydrogenase [Burkholderiales bacterium]|nr:bifunctional chorismate mutase/prephenate dehydrogenase [Burkholderiales bacterium]